MNFLRFFFSFALELLRTKLHSSTVTWRRLARCRVRQRKRKCVEVLWSVLIAIYNLSFFFLAGIPLWFRNYGRFHRSMSWWSFFNRGPWCHWDFHQKRFPHFGGEDIWCCPIIMMRIRNKAFVSLLSHFSNILFWWVATALPGSPSGLCVYVCVRVSWTPPLFPFKPKTKKKIDGSFYLSYSLAHCGVFFSPRAGGVRSGAIGEAT